MTFTDAQLDALIACEKQVKEAPRKEMKSERGYLRNDMALESPDGKHRFRVFMRQSEEFPENFSIGLDYFPGEDPGSFCMLRCNGKHGGTKVHAHHAVFHIHRSLAADINAGLKAERSIATTTAYGAYRDALAHFCKLVNVLEADTYFPGLNQALLFTDQPTAP